MLEQWIFIDSKEGSYESFIMGQLLALDDKNAFRDFKVNENFKTGQREIVYLKTPNLRMKRAIYRQLLNLEIKYYDLHGWYE